MLRSVELGGHAAVCFSPLKVTFNEAHVSIAIFRGGDITRMCKAETVWSTTLPLTTTLRILYCPSIDSRHVHFAGWADEGNGVSAWLENIDLLFNPSLTSSETFGIVNIEAMASGTPVAAFGSGGMMEYLVGGVNSLILDDTKPSIAAASIANLLQDTRQLSELRDQARQDVLEKFVAGTSVRRWAELYEALATGWPTAEATELT